MESLSRITEHKVDICQWTPIKIARNALPLSHLLFADDLILLAKANTQNSSTITDVFNQFTKYSGQQINFTKSKIYFSSNVPTSTCHIISTQLNISQTSIFGKYLGLPITNLTQYPMITNTYLIVSTQNSQDGTLTLSP